MNIRQHLAALGNALSQFAQRPVTAVINLLVIGIALSLPLGLYSGLQSIKTLAGTLPQQTRFTLFLKPEAGEADVDRIAKALKAQPAVAEFELITRAQALEQMKRRTGLADVLAALPDNPLPDAFTVIPKTTDPAAQNQLKDTLQQLPSVDLVQLDAEWAKRLDALLKLGERAALILAVLLAAALVVITGNSIRMQVLTRQEEIEISKLIGATHSYIRKPFLYFGALQGLLGGGVALAIVAVTGSQLNEALRDLTRLYGSDFQFLSLPPVEIAMTVGFSGLLCWLGALFAVNRFLAQTHPR